MTVSGGRGIKKDLSQFDARARSHRPVVKATGRAAGRGKKMYWTLS